jgi:hypothetical protein
MALSHIAVHGAVMDQEACEALDAALNTARPLWEAAEGNATRDDHDSARHYVARLAAILNRYLQEGFDA